MKKVNVPDNMYRLSLIVIGSTYNINQHRETIDFETGFATLLSSYANQIKKQLAMAIACFKDSHNFNFLSDSEEP